MKEFISFIFSFFFFILLWDIGYNIVDTYLKTYDISIIMVAGAFCYMFSDKISGMILHSLISSIEKPIKND